MQKRVEFVSIFICGSKMELPLSSKKSLHVKKALEADMTWDTATFLEKLGVNTIGILKLIN